MMAVPGIAAMLPKVHVVVMNQPAREVLDAIGKTVLGASHAALRVLAVLKGDASCIVGPVRMHCTNYQRLRGTIVAPR